MSSSVYQQSPRTPSSRKTRRTTTGSTKQAGLGRLPSDKLPDRAFTFDYTKAEVEILDSPEDDQLAASAYGNVTMSPTKSKKYSPKPKKKNAAGKSGYEFGVSGYNFDTLL